MPSRLSTPYHLLIADDDPGFRRTLRAVFEDVFETVDVESGEEAVGVFDAWRVDIALVDMHMVQMTGLETARAVHTRFQHVPFILITADADDELRSEAEQEPIFSVLSKPVRKLELVDTVSLAFETAYADHRVRSLLMN